MRIGGNRPNRSQHSEVDYDDPHESGFIQLKRACEKLADVQEVGVQDIAEGLAAAVNRRFEFETLKRQLDMRWRDS